MVVKVAGGVLGIGLIGAGGIAVTKPHWLGMDYMPTFHALSKDHDFASSEYGSGKFGDKFKNYLVGVTNKTKGNDETSSKSWWEWAFRKLQADGPNEGKFKHEGKNGDLVTQDYGTDTKALNQVCKAVYKEETTNITADGKDNKYKESEVWKYCSPLGEKPKTVSDRQENTNKYKTPNTIGNSSDNAAKLVSTKGNDLFWEIRNKEFKNEDNYGPIESGDPADAFFSTSRGKSIRDLCELAYQQPEASEANSTIDKPKKDKALKYCSLDKQ